MEDWHCFKDKVKMNVTSLTMTYRGLSQSVLGIRCPKCDAEYVLETEVMSTIKAAEALFEGK
jgi:hypothetical protein